MSGGIPRRLQPEAIRRKREEHRQPTKRSWRLDLSQYVPVNPLPENLLPQSESYPSSTEIAKPPAEVPKPGDKGKSRKSIVAQPHHETTPFVSEPDELLMDAIEGDQYRATPEKTLAIKSRPQTKEMHKIHKKDRLKEKRNEQSLIETQKEEARRKEEARQKEEERKEDARKEDARRKEEARQKEEGRKEARRKEEARQKEEERKEDARKEEAKRRKEEARQKEDERRKEEARRKEAEKHEKAKPEKRKAENEGAVQVSKRTSMDDKLDKGQRSAKTAGMIAPPKENGSTTIPYPPVKRKKVEEAEKRLKKRRKTSPRELDLILDAILETVEDFGRRSNGNLREELSSFKTGISDEISQQVASVKDYKQCKRSHAKYKAKAKRLRHKLLKIEKKRIALGIEMDKQKQELANVNEERTRIESLQAFLSDMDLLSEFITKKDTTQQKVCTLEGTVLRVDAQIQSLNVLRSVNKDLRGCVRMLAHTT